MPCRKARSAIDGVPRRHLILFFRRSAATPLFRCRLRAARRCRRRPRHLFADAARLPCRCLAAACHRLVVRFICRYISLPRSPDIISHIAVCCLRESRLLITAFSFHGDDALPVTLLLPLLLVFADVAARYRALSATAATDEFFLIADNVCLYY